AELDVDPLIKLAQAAATAAAVPTDGLHEADIPPSSSIPTDGLHEADIPPSSSVSTNEFAGGSDVPAGATTGPSTIYPSSTTVPTTSSVPALLHQFLLVVVIHLNLLHHLKEMPEREKVSLLTHPLQLSIRLSSNWKNNN
ncbi:hypothetical protein Tco_0383819, partial [Tanacetum coccineum]